MKTQTKIDVRKILKEKHKQFRKKIGENKMTTQTIPLEERIKRVLKEDLNYFSTSTDTYKQRFSASLIYGVTIPTFWNILDLFSDKPNHLAHSAAYLALLPIAGYYGFKYFKERSLKNYTQKIIYELDRPCTTKIKNKRE